MESKPSDLLMWIGVEHYPEPEDFAAECMRQGLSKRIALNNIPEGITPGQSRLFVIHPRAGLVLESDYTLDELSKALAGCGSALVAVWLDDWPRNPSWVCRQVWKYAAETHDPALLAARALLTEFEAKLVPAIFGYVYLTGTQYVCKEGEEDVPKQLRGKGVEPVRVIYDEEENDD